MRYLQRRLHWLIGLALFAAALMVYLHPPAPALAESPLPTPLPPRGMEATVTQVEPRSMSATSGGTLSVYGTGFSAQCVVRLVGYGLLDTVFVNATALKAQVPPGLPAGTYDLEVSDGVDATRFARGLTLVAPTATPAPSAPAPPPPPGRPILTLRSYSVAPQKVRAGQAFVVTLAIYNNGSRAGENTMAVFPGTTFVPVGEPGHLLWQLHINHTAVITQRLRAPASLGSGVYPVQVNLGANDWEGNHYDYPQSVPVEVVGNAPVAGQPKVTIERATTSPAVLVPGAPFSLTLRLANRGSRTALNVFATCAAEGVVPAAGSDSVSTPKIAIEGGVTVTLPLMLDAQVPGGRQKLAIALAYEDYSGGVHSNQETVGVDVDASLSSKPQVLIHGYHTTPDVVSPGDAFTLTVEIVNVGGGTAERLILALGGENGAGLEPFSPLRMGNVGFVEHLLGGSRARVHWSLMADGAAPAKAHNVPLALAYDDAQGGRHSDTQRLSLIVRRVPQVQATFYRAPEPLTVGAPTALSLEVLNVGSGAVNVTRLAAHSARMDVAMEGAPFMGPVEPGSSAPLDVSVTPREAGPADLVVSVTYRDDFNQPQTLTTTLTVDVGGGPGPGGPPGAGPTPPPAADPLRPTFWQRAGQLLKGFFGFGS